MYVHAYETVKTVRTQNLSKQWHTKTGSLHSIYNSGVHMYGTTNSLHKVKVYFEQNQWELHNCYA
jgi:hypothetical protein